MRKGKEGFQNEEVADCMMRCRGAGKQRVSEQPVIAGETGRAGLALPDHLKLKSSRPKPRTQLSGGVSVSHTRGSVLMPNA